MCRTIQNQGDAKMIRKLTLCSAAAFFALSGVAMAHDGSHLNVAQIAHIAYSAGQTDIAAGKQALAKSKNTAVQAFAEEIVPVACEVNAPDMALVKQLGVATAEAGTRAGGYKVA